MELIAPMMEARAEEVASHVIEPLIKVAGEREVEPPTIYTLSRLTEIFSVYVPHAKLMIQGIV